MDIRGFPPWVVNWARPGRLVAANGVTLKEIVTREMSWQAVPDAGDRTQMFFICDGTETKLSIGTHKGIDRAIFDLYVNGILDSSGYDDYAAGATSVQRYITLTQPIRSGKNIIELRINGKNAASSNYYLYVYGASPQ